MYAHQVLEDRDSFLKALEDKVKPPYYHHFQALDPAILTDNFKRRIKFCYNNIRSAQKFHIFQIGFLFNKKQGSSRLLFVGENNKYIRMPYRVCWIDFNVGSGIKYGILAFEIDVDLFELQFFHYGRPFNTWEPCPLYYKVSTGKPVGDEHQTMFTSGFKRTTNDNLRNKELDELDKDIVANNELGMNVFYNFLLFLNCKNITTAAISPDEKLNKKRERGGKLPLFSYRTLKLKLNAVNKKYNDSKETGIKNRLHFCRGHIKHYSAENPLFGKYTGMWWWAPSVRGNKDQGVVIKDYEVIK